MGDESINMKKVNGKTGKQEVCSSMAKVIYTRPCQLPILTEMSKENYEIAMKEHERITTEYAYFMQRDFPETIIQGLVNYKQTEGLMVKYVGNVESYSLVQNKIYDVLFEVEGYYEIIDELNEDHLFSKSDFNVMDVNK